MGAALCLILALIFLGYWLLKRYGPTALARGRGRGDAPALLGRLFLGNRQSVAVVRVAGKTLVLGVTEHQVNLLTEAGEGAFETVLKEQGHAADSHDPS